MMSRRFPYLLLFLLLSLTGGAQTATTYVTERNLPYYPASVAKSDAYIRERCVLDLYYPKGVQNFPTVVWFHGGGITGGEKELPEALQEQGIAVVGVNYRLSPKVKNPAYIEDAAAAVAWVFQHIADYGGSDELIFVSGHSAGGYLASMVGLDKRYLQKYSIDANQIAGLIPFSGHTITHFTIREERGIPGTQPIVDAYAPLYHVRPDAPPLLLITGDRELEMLGRYEENAYLMRMMKVAGHKETTLYEMDGYGHNMTAPAFPLLLNEVHRIVKRKHTSPETVEK
ncbi:Acetyl esterase/lipase [Catalinimonas alkaloidigena]|uniref:Acetyl esterase/lipase n=1 Tax=Catalinimonas alkaloidigena TaxID=1075417 RepID=A0A1G9ADV6_9BACT|nr:alpha/beta hydrolase [Catalinimonas alkaloidigena]SDK25448.1 Acetyl esterase/lipase [Catalinimonas alkaloidigena]